MANIYNNYNYNNYRKNNNYDRGNNNDDPRNKNLQKAIQQIRYHNPFERLERRSHFQNLLKEKYSKAPDILKKDNFLIFDAVAKRGGYQQVCLKNRWEEINYSILYDKKNWGLDKYYQEVLLPIQSGLIQALPFYSKSQIIEHQFVQLHLLTPTNLTAGYYQLTPAQYMFAEAHFFSLDQYYNLKTLALFQPQISKISVQYADKFMMIRKRLLFTNQIKQAALKQLKTFGISLNLQNKVFIIGLSLSSLIMADYLSQFGLHVIVFDKTKQQGKYRQENQIVQNGIVLLEGTKQQGSYYSYLANLNISLEDFNGNCALLDQDGKLISEQKIRISQEHFMAILDELKGQVMSKKKLNQQVMYRVIRRKLEHQKTLIRWHYDRYLLFNRIKGDSTTVGDLFTYQNKRFVKHIIQPYSALTIRSCSKLYQRVKAKKNVTLVSQEIQSNITFTNGIWNVHTRTDSYGGKYLIYSDHESLNRSLQEGNAKFEEIGSDVMGDSIAILQQLTSIKFINCLYSFRDKVTLKDPLKGQTCFTVNTCHGYAYYFLVGGGYEVLAVLRCYPNSNINFFKELLVILQSKCLAKTNNKMVGEQNWAYESSFSLKDEKYIQTLIRIKPIQKMYVMLPITSTNCPHRVQSQIDMTNYICALILQEIYPDYHHYDPNFKNSFQQENSNQLIQEKRNLNTPIIAENETPRKLSKSERIVVSQKKSQNISLNKQNSFKNDKINQVSAQPIKPNIQSKKMPICEDIEDTFGFSHPLIKKYEQQIKNKYKNNTKPFNLTVQTIEPIILSENLTLFSFGEPYIKEQEWFIVALAQKATTKQKIKFFGLNKIITRREEISLKNNSRMTTYYQTALVIKEVIYYCIIDENDPQILYFHNQLNILLVKFNEAIRKLKSEQANSQQLSGNLQKRIKANYPPACLTSTIISDQILSQISNMSEHLNLDNLLDERLSFALSNQKSKFMGGQLQILHTSLVPFSDSVILSELFDFQTNIQIILKQIQSYIDNLFRIEQIKPFKLFDLFFGILDEQYICCEIMKKFQQKSLGYEQIESLDGQLCQQIRQVFTRSIANQLYSLYIMPEASYLAMHRNFIHRKKQNDFEQYSYIFTKTLQGNRHYLIMDRHKIQFKQKQQIINYIIRCLVVNHKNYDIIYHLQKLIHRDIQLSYELTPKLKIYFLMTKKQIIKTVNSVSLDRFNQKCKQLNVQEKNMMSQLMRQKKIRWVENDFVFVVK